MTSPVRKIKPKVCPPAPRKSRHTRVIIRREVLAATRRLDFGVKLSDEFNR